MSRLDTSGTVFRRILAIFSISILILAAGIYLTPCFAMEHVQKNGLFSMDTPGAWHWVEAPQELFITYPDKKTVAIDIQWVPSRELTPTDIKKILKETDDKMIKQGVEAHHGTLIDDKEFKLDGVYARRLDFKTAPVNPIHVTYVSFFNKGYSFTITYGSEDDKMHSVMDDSLATFKFK
jgi:hypothetical protein